MRFLLVALSSILLGCSNDAQPEDGVYVSPREVSLVHSEVLELRNGKYRYWMMGDVGPREPIKLSGDYRVMNDRVLMEGDNTPPHDREILVDGTTMRLLRSDASEVWHKERKLHSYGTLTRVPYSFEEMCPPVNFNKEEWEQLLPKLPILKNES